MSRADEQIQSHGKIRRIHNQGVICHAPLNDWLPSRCEGAKSYSITNPGNEPAYPRIIVTGAGSKTLTVGTQTITLSLASAGETITIDSLNGQVYVGDTNAWNKITGELPVIPVSNSAITVSTTGSALTRISQLGWT